MRLFFLFLFVSVFTFFSFASPSIYQFSVGDSLLIISRKVGCSQDSIIKANPQYDFKSIQPGEKILIPEIYLVKKSDTLFSLSKLWDVSIDEIRNWNNLTESSVLKVGSSLVIPVKIQNSKDSLWPLNSLPRKENNILKAVSFDDLGKEFKSVCSGTVVYKGIFRGIGSILLIENKEKLIFAFGNFRSSVVEFGQNVKKGQVLGLTNTQAGQRFYFFVFRRGEAIDPFLARR